MAQYEVMFIVRPDLEGDDAVDQQIERFGRLIVDNGGEVTGVDKWGKRRFAYELKGYTEGSYVVIQFKSGDAVVSELSRIMRIADEVVRHIVVRLDETKSAKRGKEEPEEPAQSAEETTSEPVASSDAVTAET